VYEAGKTPRLRLDGKIDRIGLRGTNLTMKIRLENNSPAALLPQITAKRQGFFWTGSRRSRYSRRPRDTESCTA
jgi:hypothetical protein